MERVIVEISVPAISKKFDFKLPSTGYIKDIVPELVRTLELTEQNLKFDEEALLLCDMEKGTVLNPNATVAELQIKDGSVLLLA